MRSPITTLLPLALAACLAHAQSPEQNRIEILKEVNTDGVLIALALHCKHTPDDVNRLGDKLEALTLALAKNRGVALDPNTYHEAARDGFMHMREVLAVSMPADETYRTQCVEVGGKVAQKMAQ